MSILYLNGFEGFAASNMHLSFSSGNNGGGLGLFTGRFGSGKSFGSSSATDNSNFYFTFPSGLGIGDTFIFGCAIWRGNTVNDLDLRVTSDAWEDSQKWYHLGNSIGLKRNDTVRWSTSAQLNTWYYVELKYKMANSGGICVGRFNNKVIYNYTGDTQYSTQTQHYGFNIRGETGANWKVDDFYVLYVNGGENSDFLGNCRIDTLFVNGAGNYSQMIPSAGSNYECVDEDPYNASDYVETEIDGKKDSYTFQDVPTNIKDSNIFGIQLNSMSKRTYDYDNARIKHLLRKGGTDYYDDATGQILPNSFGIELAAWDLDPSDSQNWTKSKINDCEFGVELNKI